MKNYLYKTILGISLLAVISCDSDSDFLKEDPETFYTVDNAFSSAAQVDAVLVTCYAKARNIMINDNSVVLKGNGTDVLDVPTFRATDSFADYSKVNANNGKINTLYSGFYQLVASANLALYAIELPSISWESEAKKNYAVAQAKFFRAFAYRNLGELWGGVPIVDRIISEAKYDFVRSTRIETYQFAINDLESIVDYLPEQTDIPGRVVRGAAYHYLSELYLALGIELEQTGSSGDTSYQKAIKYASKVIDGGTYNLMTDRFGIRQNEAGKSVWWDLFRDDNVNYQAGNRECVWAFQIDIDSYKTKDKNSKLAYPRNYMPVMRRLQGMIGADADVGGRGIASVMPTMYVRNIIWEGIMGEDMRNAEHNIIRTFYYNNPAFPDLYGKPVPQELLVANDYNLTNYFPLFFKLTTDKFVGTDQGEDNSNLFRDEYAIRLPETILLRAEAQFRLGNLQQACDDVNMIRKRAKCSYLVTPKEMSLDFILDERARELYVEECRWNTLLRMGGTIAIDRIKKYTYHTDVTNATLNFTYNLWPIPQQVIDRNKDVVLPQNPGWK